VGEFDRAADDGSLIGSLTERELQIARPVVDRHTNAQIAAELYLSTKTVETHLRNLFHKLGVSSRVEVARTVERGQPREIKRQLSGDCPSLGVDVVIRSPERRERTAGAARQAPLHDSYLACRPG
jgi:DNA-binding CsgD family transcriptional regulator